MKAVIVIFLMFWCQNTLAQEILAALNKNNNNVVKASSEVTIVTDIDGNVYHTVTIGKQVWMAENLKTTRYSDGTSIPLVSADPLWESLTPSCKAFCWYNDDVSNKESYGALYTWTAAMNGAASSNHIPSGVQGVCPAGWHLPSDAEWTILTDYLIVNGYANSSYGIDIGKSMAATSNWIAFQVSGTVGHDQTSNNRSGFAALPSGSRLYSGAFNQAGRIGNWWRSTEQSDALAYFRYISYSNSRMYSSSCNKQNGLSIRCLKDQ